DVWVMGDHRLICGDCTKADTVAQLLGAVKPLLLVTDPPYGIALDSEWRDRAGLNGCGPAEPSYMKKRTVGHIQTKISGDTRADWSEAFEVVPSLQVVYVWHASVFTREVGRLAANRLLVPAANHLEQRTHRPHKDPLLVSARTLLVSEE